LAEALLPHAGIRAYTQGLMDLGAAVCTRSRPRCASCPFFATCAARCQGRQAELPTPRPTRVLPEQATGMLILLNGGEILLERRPAPGIWGGLWSLPECPATADPARAAADLGYLAGEARRRPACLHTFSHFRLHIQPWLVPVGRSTAVEEPGRLWLPLEDVTGAALPAPVRRILEAVRGESAQLKPV
jgi:A/G-specific adenine glycosylase